MSPPMFASVRRCAELITQPCRHKVKVTVQGHRFLPWISCPLCISYTIGRFFFKLWSNVHYSEMMCRINNSTMPAKVKVTGQGHGFEPWISCPSISPIPLEGFSFNFGQMFASVKWCAEPIAQLCRLTRSQFKVTGSCLEFCVGSVSPLPLKGFSLNFGQMFTSVGQCAEPITQPCRLKVKVTVEGHRFEPWIWCRLHISFIPGRIFFKGWSNVWHSEMMCRTKNSAVLTLDQGHNWRSPVWALNFEAAPLPFRLPC